MNVGYPKEVYEKAWEILDGRRVGTRRTLEQNQREARINIPEIGEIQQKMMETGAKITKAVVNTPEQGANLVRKLGEENLGLQHRREQLLAEHGYPRDFLKEKFFCSKCDDTGYVATKMCDCFAILLKQQAFAQLSQVSDSTKSTFRDFSLDFYSNAPGTGGVVPRQRMSEIFEFSKLYAKTFSIDSPSLLMLGRTGLGKTHLSLSIAWEITQNGFGVVYTPVQKLMDKLESFKFSYNQEDKTQYSQHMDSVMECDLLVLDDLGTEFPTSFTKSVLYNIVNTRLVEGRPTIINTNLNPNELETAYSQRMASRLGFEYKILPFFGEDIRSIKRERRFKRNN